MKCDICSGNIPQTGVWKFNNQDVCNDCYGEINSEPASAIEHLEIVAWAAMGTILFLWWAL